MALWDRFPVSKGHTLVLPKRHVASIYDLQQGEQAVMRQLVADVRERLQDQFAPDGFNIDVNDGEAAGQTMAHARIHIIPRYEGDVDDPRGRRPK